MSRPRPAPQRCSARAAPFTSVSTPTGTPSARRNGPARSTWAQPSLGVVVMKPNVGECACRSTGPNVARPRAARGQRRVCSVKNVTARWIVSAGPVLASRVSARTSWGPVPMAQTSLVPPTSTPPTSGAPAASVSAVVEMLYPPRAAPRRPSLAARAPLEEDTMSADLRYTPAIELARQIRAKALSPVELTRAVLERIERAESDGQRVLHGDGRGGAGDGAGGRARGDAGRAPGRSPRHPLLDQGPVADGGGGRRSSARTCSRSALGEVDAPFVRRLEGGGWRDAREDHHAGVRLEGARRQPVDRHQPHPWDPATTPGGSSAGAGIAAALGLGPLAQGSDGAGSIRIPSSFCGIFGLKPSYGRVPMWPAVLQRLASHTGPDDAHRGRRGAHARA